MRWIIMKYEEIKTLVKNANDWDYREIEYKRETDQEKYGTSFDAIFKDDYQYIKVNGLTFRCKRIIEEFGLILFLYNHNQIEINPTDITTLEFGV